MGHIERIFRAVEICAGAGGQALGLERAGFEHDLLIELDDDAAATLRLNRPAWKVVTGDVADRCVWNPIDYAGSVDLLAGGVPCPPFTVAGKQQGATDERDLFAWAVEQVEIVRPRALLLENVRGLSQPRFAGYRQHVLDRLREFGYVADWKMVNACDYGVPQLRPRFILVAMTPEDFPYFHWPISAPAPLTVGQALLPLMSANDWDGAEAWARRANRIAPTLVGGSKKHGGADLGPTRAKAEWAKMGVNGWALADAAPFGGEVFEVGPKLTCEMAARLQGWDEGEFQWVFNGRKTARYRQIGNAFPPPMAKALGMAISAALSRTTTPRERVAEPEHDSVYRVLRERGDFMTIDQIARATKSGLKAYELERHINLLRQDFEFVVRDSDPVAYKIGNIKAFRGEADHVRNERFKQERRRIS
ncbi:DNA (cytosine-5-)-methyltransferase [Nonomuraea sp. PA05]|uniref:DNA cytosine methyltransferase n=1 Tax=Nonomuraea sp. PA05 TaxID=2604466 RepID=UPI0011D33AFC|nr:DNA (cytosine-5-)-methyltransferase [Nonomuraea sp. PA05]TYB58915.1 DNA (cytosine-5-)-methyltransferase [Nonomuraea sp. PA05]